MDGAPTPDLDHATVDTSIDELPADPAALLALLAEVDPADAPDVAARLASALEAALAATDTTRPA